MAPVTLSSATQTSLTVKWSDKVTGLAEWVKSVTATIPTIEEYWKAYLTYVIEVSNSFEDGPPKVYTTGEGSAAATATSHEIDGLSAGTWYDIKIRAVIQSQPSASCCVVTATDLGGVDRLSPAGRSARSTPDGSVWRRRPNPATGGDRRRGVPTCQPVTVMIVDG